MDRSRMSVRVVPLRSSEARDPRMGGTIAERVAAVALLSVEAWRLAGRSLPSYTRETIPVMLTTLEDHRAER